MPAVAAVAGELDSQNRPRDDSVVLRDFPFPYRAMLAISTDIDGTLLDNFREVHRFLNTRESTAMGEGVGLDIANSCWIFDTPGAGHDSVSYFRSWSDHTPNPAADELVAYIRAGWIDTLHSYGNFTAADRLGGGFSRALAIAALEVFAKRNLSLPVWTNHGDRCNTQNIGRDETTQGDMPDRAAYHADLLPRIGVQYLWRQFRQDVAGHRSVIAPWSLKDGQSFFAFPRFTSRVGYERAGEVGTRFDMRNGIGRNGKPWIMLWRPQVFHEQVSDDMLDDLEQNRQFSVVAQHLGFLRPMNMLDRHSVGAFRRLRQRQDAGRILVARTSRLLHYNRVRDHLRYAIATEGDGPDIDILEVEDPIRGRWLPTIDDLRGLTFEVIAPERWKIRLGGRPLPESEIARHGPASGSGAIGIRWFASDIVDHTREFTARDRRRLLLWSKAAREEVGLVGATMAANLESDLARTDRTAEQRAAIQYAQGRYTVGLVHYAGLMERIGFAGLQTGLDIGCGAGHWCFGFLRHGARSVTGIDMRAEYAELCRDLAARAGLADRARFMVGRGEQLPLPDDHFDAAWSHSTVMYGDPEKMLQEAARALRRSGYFYCGFTSLGLRLLSVFTCLAAADADMALTHAHIILNGYLNRYGVYHTDGSRVRMLETEDVVRCTRALGFTYVGEPQVQDEAGRFLAFDRTGDLVVQKSAAPDDIRAQLASGTGLWGDWREDLRALLAAGCAGVVADVLGARDDTAGDTELRRLHALALIRSGRARGAHVRARLDSQGVAGQLDPYTLGLFCFDQGETDAALRWFLQTDDTADRCFLTGMCHFATRRWADAAECFATGLQRDPASPALAVGMLAANLHRGDQRGARTVFAAMCRLNRGQIAADTIEEALAFMDSRAFVNRDFAEASVKVREEWWPRLSDG
jgi:SAM-dependent methyltransferase